MQVNYLFDLNQNVVDPFGSDGIITMLALDAGGKSYFVQRATSSEWFHEGQLKSAK